MNTFEKEEKNSIKAIAIIFLIIVLGVTIFSQRPKIDSPKSIVIGPAESPKKTITEKVGNKVGEKSTEFGKGFFKGAWDELRGKK